MTLKELEAWHRREAEGLCVALRPRIAVALTMRSPVKVPKTAETERGGILRLRICWPIPTVQGRSNHDAASV
jgi:hypothetical protein